MEHINLIMIYYSDKKLKKKIAYPVTWYDKKYHWFDVSS